MRGRAIASPAAQALDEATTLDREIGSPWTRAHLQHLRALDATLTGDFASARAGQHTFAARMIELGDPAGAATGRYLAATMGDMMGSRAVLADVLADLSAARDLAEQVGDMSLLSRVLLLEARVLQKSNDARGRALLLDAVDRLTEQGGIGAAALRRVAISGCSRCVTARPTRPKPSSASSHRCCCGSTARRPRRPGPRSRHSPRRAVSATSRASSPAPPAASASRPRHGRAEDEQWVEELLDPLGLPPAPDAVTDEELLALAAG